MNNALKTKQKGFNLAEMMTTLAITSILSATAVPAFDGVIERSQLDAAKSEMSSSLALARSEAINRNINTAICTSAGSTCDNSISWTEGWIVFVDENNNGTRDNAEELLYVNQLGLGKVRVVSNTQVSNVRFRSDGSVINSGSIDVCAGSDNGLNIAITPIGRTYSSKLDSSTCSA